MSICASRSPIFNAVPHGRIAATTNENYTLLTTDSCTGAQEWVRKGTPLADAPTDD